MTKKEIISIISKCAHLYADNLCNKQLALIFLDNTKQIRFLEITFRSNNFLHFTGVKTSKHIKANKFYTDALEHRLKESNICLKDKRTAEMKLQILADMMKLPYSARMIGDYTGPRVELYTEKITGTISYSLGLIKSHHTYIPNTILKEDIRNITPKPPGKILAILRKELSQNKYSEITYQSKTLPLPKIQIPIKLLLQMNSTLLEKF